MANSKNLSPIKLLYGEAPHHILYITWIYLFAKGDYLFLVPLALSTLGKSLLLIDASSEESTDKAQELILFQVKCEAFILGFLLLSLFKFNLLSLLEFITFAFFVKIKYSFYSPAQKAFVELHFAFDNLTRKWRIRPIYHIFYMGINLLSGTYSTERELLYW